MTASQIEMEASRICGSGPTQVGQFLFPGSGNSIYEVYRSTNEAEKTDHQDMDTLLVTDGEFRPKAVLALRDLHSGEPIVDILQVGDSIDRHPRLLEKILEITFDAAFHTTNARRLRLGTEETNVSADVLTPSFGRDNGDPTHVTYQYPRYVPSAA